MKTTTRELNLKKSKADVIIISSFEDKKLLDNSYSQLEKLTGSKIPSLVKKDFEGKESQVKNFYLGDRRVILTGLGKKESCKLETLRCAVARAVKVADSMGVPGAGIILYEDNLNGNSLEDIVIAQVEAAYLSRYKFDKYFKVKKEKKVYLENLEFLSDSKKLSQIQKYVNDGVIIAESTINARDIGNEPSNIATPVHVANKIVEYGKKYGYSVKVYDKKELTRKKFGLILAVGQGSANEPRMIVMTYNGGKKGDKPYALVGKGVTFDTGGISIKPSAGMENMKMDMNGSAAVIGAMNAIARLKLKVNIVAVVGMVENMPSSTAYKPGDVVVGYDGTTVEVQNTDAEGRLVLGDCVAFVTEYKPKFIVDIATLTGAALIALGHISTALISNNDDLSGKLIKAGNDTHERVWRLPDWDDYDRLIDSEIADVSNVGQGRQAGTIVGGLFVKRFAKDYPWAHLDIAGTGMSPKAGDYSPKFSSGVGVRLLTKMFKDLQ